MNFNNLGRVAGASAWGIFSARGGVGGLRWGLLALALLAVTALPLLFGAGTAQAQQPTPVDYDTDDDGLIEVDSLAKLNAMRWDLNGDGKVAAGDQSNYDAAFPNAAADMGCGAMDHDGDATTPDQPVCKGYELTANLTFDEDGDGDVDSDDATYWNGGAGWEPMGQPSSISTRPSTLGLAAAFEGNGNTIDYLFINRPEEEHGPDRLGWIGLFRSIGETGAARNLSLTNVNVSGGELTGALAGGIYGSVSGVSASGTVSGKNETGGIAGFAGCRGCPVVHIANTSFGGTVTGTWDTGGLLGVSYARIEGSNSAAAVTGTNAVGGLVGRMYSGSIVSSHASGKVIGQLSVGGLAGHILAGDISKGTVIERSYATGDVSGRTAGGFVGWNSGNIKYSYATGAVDGLESSGGGFVGINDSSGVITASYATGAVIAKLAGGFAGDNYNLIQDSYASGQVTGKQYAGGFLACNLSNIIRHVKAQVRRSYASGEVGLVAAPLPGNLLGGFSAMNAHGTRVTDSYWDTTVSRQASSAGGTGYTTAELQAPTGYTGIYLVWDVDLSVITGNNADTGRANLWDFGTASQYPALQADFDGDGTATACEFGDQGRCASSATGDSGQRGADAGNRAPVFLEGEAALRQVMENTAAGTGIGAPVEATDPYGGNALVYSLGTTAHDNHFAIDRASGQLRVQGPLDYEGTNTYAVTVSVSDGSLSDSITVTINVMDVLDEGDDLSARAAEPPAPEPPADPAGMLRLDQERDTGSAVTAEDASMLIRWAAAPEADADTYYRLRRKPDVDGSRTQVIVKEIRDGGERDSDERPGQVAYRDSDDALVPGQGYVYGVRTFYGDGSRSRWQRVGAEPPAFADASIALSVAENTSAGTDIGAPITATDPDGDVLTYALGGADAGHFAIDAATGQLQTKGALDYESGDSYAVTVTATDPGGLSASIAVSIEVTDVADTPPGQPAPPTFTNIAETGFRILWSAPTPGSSPVDGVGLQYKPSSASDEAWADVKPAPGTGRRGFNLTNRGGQHVTAGASYDVRVRERNAQGWGPWSDAGTVTTVGAARAQPARPEAPTFTYVQETRFRVVWQAPAPGASPITGYGLQYKLSSASDDAWANVSPTPRGTSRGYNLTNRRGQSVVPGTSYDVRVRAQNAQGWGQWSEAGTVTTAGTAQVQPARPEAPAFTEVQETRFRILWQAPAPGASPITGYGIQYKLSSASDEAWADVKPEPRGVRAAGFNLTNRRGQSIAPGTSYDVRVRAQNAQGWGEWSEAGTVTTAGTAPAGS